MRRLFLLLGIITILAAGATTATAAKRPLGVRGGYSMDPGQVFFGVHTWLDKPAPEIWLVPNIELGFGDDVTVFSIALAGRYRIYRHDMADFKPYLGAEVGYYTWMFSDNLGGGSDGKAALSLLGGLEKRLDPGRNLFFELRLGLSDYTPDVKFTAGLTFF